MWKKAIRNKAKKKYKMDFWKKDNTMFNPQVYHSLGKLNWNWDLFRGDKDNTAFLIVINLFVCFIDINYLIGISSRFA
jgi:hypothetical protein